MTEQRSYTAADITAAYRAGFIEAAKWPSICTQDAESRAVDEAARAYAATLKAPAQGGVTDATPRAFKRAALEAALSAQQQAESVGVIEGIDDETNTVNVEWNGPISAGDELFTAPPAQPAERVPEGWTREQAKLHERKTVHIWLNDLSIEREESGRPLCLLRRLSILRDRYYEACQQLSFEARKPAGWISLDVSRPARNTSAIYWHRSDNGGFVAIADEWRDEHHLAHASHWMPYVGPASPAQPADSKVIGADSQIKPERVPEGWVPVTALRDLYRAYVRTLEAGMDRITSLGGSCNSAEDMELCDPALSEARRAMLAASPAPSPARGDGGEG